MSDNPNAKTIPKKTTAKDDEENYTSTNGDSVADRYRKVREHEAQMTQDDLLKELEAGAKYFDSLLIDEPEPLENEE